MLGGSAGVQSWLCTRLHRLPCALRRSVLLAFAPFRLAAMVRRAVRIAILAAMAIPATATHGGSEATAKKMMELDWDKRHEWWGWTLRLCTGPTIAVFNAISDFVAGKLFTKYITTCELAAIFFCTTAWSAAHHAGETHGWPMPRPIC